VAALIDGLTPVADAIGAVNTLVKKEGRLIGHNTDAAGFLADLYAFDIHISSRPVLVLGAGGAARAVVAACAGVGAEIRVAARLRARAESLKEIAPGVSVYDLTLHDLERAGRDAALIVNCTTVGMSPQVESSPWFESAAFPPGAFVYDLVYNPTVTRLVRQARAAGLRAATGLGMLVEQGALAFELWTGQTAPRRLMRDVAEMSLRNA
jgi:shikimate dehydrogenase